MIWIGTVTPERMNAIVVSIAPHTPPTALLLISVPHSRLIAVYMSAVGKTTITPSNMHTPIGCPEQPYEQERDKRLCQCHHEHGQRIPENEIRGGHRRGKQACEKRRRAILGDQHAGEQRDEHRRIGGDGRGQLIAGDCRST